MSGYSELLNWAVATGRIRAEDRTTWVARIVEGPGTAARVVATIVAAAPDPKCGDFLAPWPHGWGSPADSVTVAVAKRSAARGRRVAASRGAVTPVTPLFIGSQEPTRLVKEAWMQDDDHDKPLQLSEALAAVPPPAGSQPKMFGNSDLPAVTASGIDPTVLKRVPECARFALARAATLSEANEILVSCSGPEGSAEDTWAQMNYGRDPEYQVYLERVARWASGFE